MSVHKETKVRNLIQQRGLLHVGSSRTAATDIGIVGEYTSSGTKYTGLFRDDTDGVWNLFEGISTSPFSADAVSKVDVGFTLGTMALGQLNTNGISSAVDNGDLTIAAKGTGKVVLGATQLATVPTASNDIANKSYVDSQVTQAVQGWVSKESVDARTVSALSVTASGMSVGKTLTSTVNEDITAAAAAFDGVALTINDRVLVANQSHLPDNGIYVVTDVGSVGTPWVLTRSTDADESPTGELSRGAHVFVDDGTQYKSTGWVLQGPFDTFSIDHATDGNQIWVKFSKDTAVVYSAANQGPGLGVFAGMNGNQFLFDSFQATQVGGAADLFTLNDTTNGALTYTFDQSKLTGTGALASGTIAPGFGAIATNSSIGGASLSTTSSLAFGGLSGANVVTMPGLAADALHFSAGGDEYLRFDSNAGNAVVSKPLLLNNVTDAGASAVTQDTLRKLSRRNAVSAVGDLDQIVYTTSGSGPTFRITRTANGPISGESALFDNTAITTIGTRVLMTGLSGNIDSGIYYVEDLGSAGTQWVLRRALDLSESQHFSNGVVVDVIDGAKYGGSSWMNTQTNVVLDTTVLVFTQRAIASNLQKFNGDGVMSLGSNNAAALTVRDSLGNGLIAYDTTTGATKVAVGSDTQFLIAKPVTRQSDPTAAITRDYLDSKSFKGKVVAATTANLAATHSMSGSTHVLTATALVTIASASASVDGVVLVTGDRVLVRSQTDQAHNGIYYVANPGAAGSEAWELHREHDADTATKLTQGVYTLVAGGSSLARTFWAVSTAPSVLETDPIVWTQVSSVSATQLLASGGQVANVYKQNASGTLEFRAVEAAVGANSTDALQLTEVADKVTVKFDQAKITGTGQLTSGSITSGFGDITTSSLISGGSLETDGLLKFTGPTGSNTVDIAPNQTDALRVTDGVYSYLKFQTTDQDEKVIMSRPVELGGTLTVSGAATVNGAVTATGGATVSSGLTVNGGATIANDGLAFTGATGVNTVDITHNQLDALRVTDGIYTYLKFQTADTDEKTIAVQPFETQGTLTSGGKLTAIGLVDAKAGVTVAGGVTVESGGLEFTGLTGSNTVDIAPNQLEALRVTDGVYSYLKFQTTDQDEKVIVDRPLHTKNIEVVGGMNVTGDATLASAYITTMGETGSAAVNLGYLRARDYKDAVRVSTTGQLTTVATFTTQAGGSWEANANENISTRSSVFDTVALVQGDRIIVRGQTDPTTNGIYYVSYAGNASFPWLISRAPDANISGLISHGTYVPVVEGSSWARTFWMVTSAGEVLNTDPIVFGQVSASTNASQLTASAGQVANVYKQNNGGTLEFRAVEAAVGTNPTSSFELVEGAGKVTAKFDQSKITGTGELTAGSIATGFGAITTANTIRGGHLESGFGLDFKGTFNGANHVKFASTHSSALLFTDGSTNYIDFDATRGTTKLIAPVEVGTSLKFVSPSANTNRVVLKDGLDSALTFQDDAAVPNKYIEFDTDPFGDSLRQVRFIQNARFEGGAVFPGGSTFSTMNINDDVAVASDVSFDLVDNKINAFEIKEGANSYMKFVTTDGVEKVVVGKTLDAQAVTATDAALTSATVVNAPATATGVVNRSYFNTRAVKDTVALATTAPLTVVAAGTGPGATLTSTVNQDINDIAGTHWDNAGFGGVPRRVLVWQQTDARQNGIYDVTDMGSVSTPWVLTRSIDFCETGHAPRGTVVPVFIGDRYQGSIFSLNSFNITFGTSNITFTVRGLGTGNLQFNSGESINSIIMQNNYNEALNVRSFAGDSFLQFKTTTSDRRIIANQPVHLKSQVFAGLSGVNKIRVPDNLAVALDLESADGQRYMRVVTTDGSEHVEFGQDAVFKSDLTVEGQAQTTFGEFKFANTNTANNKITVQASLADALSVQTGDAAKYLTFNTAFGSGAGRVEVVRSLNAQNSLKVDGNTSLQSGLQFKVDSINSSTGLNDTHNVVNVTTGASDITLTLPPVASHVGRTYKIAKADSGAGRVIIAPDTTDLIDGENAGLTLDVQYDYTRLTCHGALGWFLH